MSKEDQRKSWLYEALLLGSVIFAACLFGIWTRPIGFLATVWPANAVMLGLLLRRPATAQPLGWLAAGVAYLAADLLTGSTLIKALLLNGANIAGVGTAYLICARLPGNVLRLQHPTSLFYIALASGAGAAAAGVVGGFANPIIFNRSPLSGLTFWLATEFINYAAILPVILSAPSLATLEQDWKRLTSQPFLWTALPALVLVFACLAATLVGGPGAIAFPVPALLWCGLAYSVFPTSVLTMFFGIWSLAFISSAYLVGAPGSFDETALTSIRLAASLIAFGPIMLAVVMQNRNDLLARLHHLATHDQLTGTDSRHAFREKAELLLMRRAETAAVLMIDLDHFKTVNDTYGHAAGDEVLVCFAQRVRDCLRPFDVFGRVGGEEFAAVISACPKQEAARISERIREALAGTPIRLSDGRSVTVTASIGVSIVTVEGRIGIDRLLASADTALYRAKTQGRNRVEISLVESAAIPL